MFVKLLAVFFSSWDDLLKNIREANVKFLKASKRGGLGNSEG